MQFIKQDLKQDIRSYVIDQLLFGQENYHLSDGDSFLDNGIIDSTGVLELIGFVEDKYMIKIEHQELVPENLDSIDRLAGFIERKLAPTSGE